MRRVVHKSYSLILASLLVFGCNKSNDGNQLVLKIERLKGTPLVDVGNVTLSLEEIKEDFLSRQGSFRGADMLNTPEKKNEFAEQAAIKEAILQEALASDYVNKTVELRRDIKELIVQRYVRDRLQDEQAKFEATPEEIKKYYDDNKDLFSKKEAVKVTYMKVPYGTDKIKAKKLADDLKKEAVKTVTNANTTAFLKVAMKHMDPAHALKGGTRVEAAHTGFEEKNTLDEKFGNGAFDTALALSEIGHISNTFEGKDGWVVMMKTGYRKAVDETFEDAQEKIKKKLAFDNRGNLYKSFTDQIKKKYPVTIHENALALLSDGNTAKEAKLDPPQQAQAIPGNPGQVPPPAAGHVAPPMQQMPNNQAQPPVPGAVPTPAPNAPAAGAQR